MPIRARPRRSARRGGSSVSIAAHSAAARPSTTPGITCRCSRASPAPCATARRSRIGCCRRLWNASGVSSPAPMTAIGGWWISSPQCSPTGCRRSRLPAPRRWPKGVIRPTEAGDRLVIRSQPARQPHYFNIASGLALKPPARLDAIEVAVNVKLQQSRRMIRFHSLFGE